MRILFADGQPKVRLALRLLLEQETGLSVVGEAAEAGGLATQIEATCPDLLLLDWCLPGAAMNELLFDLHSARPDLPIIILSGRPETEKVALAAGADAFVSKTDPPEELLAVILSARRVGSEG